MVFNSTGQCVWRDKKKKKCILCNNSVPSGNKIEDNIKLYNTLEMKTKCLLSKKKKRKKQFLIKLAPEYVNEQVRLSLKLL